jgi:EAL domain-containing protein (putative c-di-GMP-specific phosphodiesterase class I)/CheY-like chemotaxis protein
VSPPVATVRVVVADDDLLLREVLVELLGPDDRFEVVAAVADAAAAVDAARREQPTVALVDVKMPGGGGQRVATELRTVSPLTRVVALSSYDDRASIVEMFRAGAVSYLVKGAASNAEIVSTLLRVAAGEVVLSPTVGAHLLDELTRHLERAHLVEQDRRTITARLEQVLASRRLRIVYQPIVDLASRKLHGVEALARFPGDPTRGPDRWFADAQAVGLQADLELLAVRSAVEAVEYLPQDGYVALNVSPHTACDTALQALVLGSDPTRTVVEITEHAPIADYDEFSRAIEPLRAAGVRLAVDDAGAGFASLRHILLLAPDVIKLDLSLTQGVDTDRNRRALARALISFSSDIGATIVAEGIETASELAALRELGVKLGQGYLLGRPVPLDEVVAAGGGQSR